MSKEKIFQRPVLTAAWDAITDKNPSFFDTTNDYPKKYHIDGMKDGPIGWEDDLMTVADTHDCIEDDVCTAILTKARDKVLVVVAKALPHILIQGKGQKKISWDEYAEKGVWAIKKAFPTHKLEAVVINPKIKTLEDLGVLKSIITQVLADKDLTQGGKDEPARKSNPGNQASPHPQGPDPGISPPDSGDCE